MRADECFVENEGWYEAAERYQHFLSTRKGRILFLELGVGYNTPVIIKIPFIRMTAERKDAIYACINFGEAFAPEEIKDRAIVINDDIGDILDQLDSSCLNLRKDGSIDITG